MFALLATAVVALVLGFVTCSLVEKRFRLGWLLAIGLAVLPAAAIGISMQFASWGLAWGLLLLVPAAIGWGLGGFGGIVAQRILRNDS